jgi:galactokinase
VSDRAAKVSAAARGFRDRFTTSPRVFSAPGRVNLIGEHTDYNDGFVLPIAIGERTYVAAAARSDTTIRAYSLELKKDRSFSLSEPWARRGKWLDYVEGVARALLARGVSVSGADLYISSDVPVGAGLSSSAALELAVGLALNTLAGGALAPRELALAGRTAENDFVGVRSGVMDQFASALGRRGHALFIDCRSLEVTPVALPKADVKFVVCDTRVHHAHSQNGYNQRRDECQQALVLLQKAGRPIESLRGLGIEELNDIGRILPDPLDRRVRHVVRENARTAAAVDALRHGHLAAFGRLMNGSHASLRDDYEVSAPELDFVVAQAQRQAGVLGARMTGGGFGGSAVVLVEAADVEPLFEALSRSYAAKFGKEPTLRVAVASDGVREEREATA